MIRNSEISAQGSNVSIDIKTGCRQAASHRRATVAVSQYDLRFHPWPYRKHSVLAAPETSTLKTLNVEIFAKAEWFNPGGSVKDRAALAMITEGERSGALTKDKTIIDATSGNTGIAYAMIGRVLGYRVTLALPSNASRSENRFSGPTGRNLILTDPGSGTDGAQELVKEIVAA